MEVRQIRALRCQTHAFAKRRANRPFRFFPPLLRHKTAYASLGSKQPCRHVVEFRPAQEDEAGKKGSGDRDAFACCYHVVDVVAIPLLCVLRFWHILKPLYSLHLFCLLLHPFALFRTVRNYTMLTQTIQIHMEHAAQHVFGLQSKASVRSQRAWHLAQRMLFELTGLSTCHPMWIHVA